MSRPTERKDAMPVRMSEEGFAAFLEAVSAPAAAVPEIVALMQRQAPWEGAPPSHRTEKRPKS